MPLGYSHALHVDLPVRVCKASSQQFTHHRPGYACLPHSIGIAEALLLMLLLLMLILMLLTLLLLLLLLLLETTDQQAC